MIGSFQALSQSIPCQEKFDLLAREMSFVDSQSGNPLPDVNLESYGDEGSSYRKAYGTVKLEQKNNLVKRQLVATYTEGTGVQLYMEHEVPVLPTSMNLARAYLSPSRRVDIQLVLDETSCKMNSAKIILSEHNSFGGSRTKEHVTSLNTCDQNPNIKEDISDLEASSISGLYGLICAAFDFNQPHEGSVKEVGTGITRK